METPAQEFNFAFEVLRRAELTPSAIAIRAPTWALTYGQVRSLVISFAHHLRLRGVDRKACVMLMANRLPEGLILGLAIAALGSRWVRASDNVPQESLGVTHAVALTQPKVIPHHNFHVVDASWAEPSGIPELDGYGSSDDTASFAASSGTTGRIKYIGKSYRVMAARIRQSSQEGTSLFCLFAPLSGAGFHALTSALAAGSTIIAAASDFSEVARQGAESRVLASPAQMETFLGQGSLAPARLPLLIAKGSSVGTSLIQEWLRYFRSVEIDYGSQEVGLVGSTRFNSGADLEGTRLAYRPYSGASVEVVDASGASCAAETEGVVRIRTPSMVLQYADSPMDTAEAFREGWFYPGDLGSLTQDGRLRIHGRTKDQFNFGGIKVNAADIDAAAAEATDVRAAVSFARTNVRGLSELCVLAVAAQGAVREFVAGDIRRRCAALRGEQLAPASVYFADQLPLNENGKPARDAAQRIADSAVPY
jgi:acyl-coenzyme A synthetase/AMP-(fatty) acid ligase